MSRGEQDYCGGMMSSRGIAILRARNSELREAWSKRLREEGETMNTGMDVHFEFDLGEGVITPFGEQAYVTMLAIDEGGVLKVRVRSKSKEKAWWLQAELKAAPVQEELGIGEEDEGEGFVA